MGPRAPKTPMAMMGRRSAKTKDARPTAVVRLVMTTSSEVCCKERAIARLFSSSESCVMLVASFKRTVAKRINAENLQGPSSCFGYGSS